MFKFFPLELSDDLKEIINSFTPKNEFKLTENDKKIINYQIVDILFAYAYDYRTTEGDRSVESGWTINKLSSTLSWLEVVN